MAPGVVSCERGGARGAVVEAGHRWATGQYDLVRLVAELDASLDWSLDGAPTCAHWVAAALDVEVCTAREWLRIGRALRDLPAIASGFEARRLSYSKVRALSRVATRANEAELCAIAERVAAGRLAHALASWLQRHDAPEETTARHTAGTGLTPRLEPDGMGLITLRLPPLDHGAVMAAVDARVLVSQSSAHASADASGRWPSIAQQRAHAFMELLREGGATITTEVIVHVRGDGCTMDDGTPVTDHAVAPAAPEAFIRLLITEANGSRSTPPDVTATPRNASSGSPANVTPTDVSNADPPTCSKTTTSPATPKAARRSSTSSNPAAPAATTDGTVRRSSARETDALR